MRIKVSSKNNSIIKDIICNRKPYCEFCGMQEAIGVFSTCIGRKTLCINCVKEYFIQLEQKDYLFLDSLELNNNEIFVQNEKLELIDAETNKPICLTKQV